MEHDVLVKEGVLAARCCQAKDDSRYRGPSSAEHPSDRILIRFNHSLTTSTDICITLLRQTIRSRLQKNASSTQDWCGRRRVCRANRTPQILANQPIPSTNTDGVILDPTKASEPGKGVVAWYVLTSDNGPQFV
jgi:hypothetical protein